MARYTFGGDIHDLVSRPDASAGGALKLAPNLALQLYTVATGGSPASDFLLDSDGNGTFDQAVAQISTMGTGYLPDFQGPDGIEVLYYDPDVTDSDVRRVRLVARDSGTGGLTPASQTSAGVQRNATDAEADAGASVTTTMTPYEVQRRITAHVNSISPHPEYNDALDALSTSLSQKASLDTNGDVIMDQLPVSIGAVPDLIVQRGSDGTASAANAIADANLTTLSQVRTLVGSSTALTGNDVRGLSYAPTTPVSSASASTFVTIPNIAVTDAASGQVWRCEYDIFYRASAAGGIQVRHVGNTATATNLLPNPSFETNLTGWNADTAVASLSRGTTGGQDGTGYLIVTATGSGALNVSSDWFPATSSVYSAAAWARTHAGTTRSFAVDIFYQNATGSSTGNDLGALNALTAGYQQITNGSTTGSATPAGTAQVKIRLRYPNAVTGDAIRVDTVQLEPTAPLPAFGSTGGGGASALTGWGSWSGLTNGATTTDNGSKLTPIRSSVTGWTTAHGGLGTTTDALLKGSIEVTVGGTGLTNQRIELEFAQRVTDAANATTIQAARATFARLA